MKPYIIFSEKLFLIVSKPEVWVPSSSLLYFVLVIGALLTAGVAMSALSFYEDFYWADKEFRDHLRFNPLQKVERSSK